MISFNSDLVMAWSYVLSISALRQPRSSTSASRARSRSAGLLNNSRTFFTRKVVCKWRIVCGVMPGNTTRSASGCCGADPKWRCALASKRLKTMPKPEYSSCCLRRERKIGSSSSSCSSRVRRCGSSCDRSRAMYRWSCSRVSAEHQIGESQHLRDARPALQHDAQDDGFAGWRVVDHVAHPGQDRQTRGLRVACDRRLKRLHPHLEEADRLAGRVGT